MKFPAADLLASAFFVICLLTTGIGALIAVFTTRIIRSVCGLAITCFGLAGLYYFLNSPFLALMEILIYVGAVCVTIVFAVMLSEPDEPPREETKGTVVLWAGIALLASGAIFFRLWQLSLTAGWTQPVKRVSEGSVRVPPACIRLRHNARCLLRPGQWALRDPRQPKRPARRSRRASQSARRPTGNAAIWWS